MLVEQGHPVAKALKHANVSSSTWYKRKKVLGEDRRAHNKGRPIPGYSVNPDGSIITDETIVNAVKEIRKRELFQYGGGYKKLAHYLRRDFNIYVNGKNLYRLCKEHDLLLHRKKKRWRRGRRVCENRKITGPNLTTLGPSQFRGLASAVGPANSDIFVRISKRYGVVAQQERLLVYEQVP